MRNLVVVIIALTLLSLSVCTSCRQLCEHKFVNEMNIDELARGVNSATLLWQVFRAQNCFDDEIQNRSPQQFCIQFSQCEGISSATYFTWMQVPDSWPVDLLLRGLALPGVPIARGPTNIEPENVAWSVVCGPDPLAWHAECPLFISRNLNITTGDLQTKRADDYVYCSTNAPFGREFSLCVRIGGRISVFYGSMVRVGELFPEFMLTNRVSYSIWRPE